MFIWVLQNAPLCRSAHVFYRKREMERRGFKTIKKQVLWCLENREATRNSDKLLWLSLCKNFYHKDFVDFIYLCAKAADVSIERTIRTPGEWGNLPSFETVRRVRQKIQNEDKLFPPTDEIAAQRRKNVGIYKEELGYK